MTGPLPWLWSLIFEPSSHQVLAMALLQVSVLGNATGCLTPRSTPLVHAVTRSVRMDYDVGQELRVEADSAVLRCLLAARAEVDRVNPEHGTALMAAVNRGHLHTARLLLRSSADPNVVHRGQSALSLANGNPEMLAPLAGTEDATRLDEWMGELTLQADAAGDTPPSPPAERRSVWEELAVRSLPGRPGGGNQQHGGDRRVAAAVRQSCLLKLVALPQTGVTGDACEVFVEASESVQAIIDQYARRVGCDPMSLRVSHEDRRLPAARSIEQCGLTHGAQVDIFAKQIGGGDEPPLPPLSPPPPPFEKLRWRLPTPQPPSNAERLLLHDACDAACAASTAASTAVSRSLYDQAVAAGQLIVRTAEQQEDLEQALGSTIHSVRRWAHGRGHMQPIEWHRTLYTKSYLMEHGFTAPSDDAPTITCVARDDGFYEVQHVFVSMGAHREGERERATMDRSREAMLALARARYDDSETEGQPTARRCRPKAVRGESSEIAERGTKAFNGTMLSCAPLRVHLSPPQLLVSFLSPFLTLIHPRRWRPRPPRQRPTGEGAWLCRAVGGSLRPKRGRTLRHRAAHRRPRTRLLRPGGGALP